MRIVICDDNKMFGEELTEFILQTVLSSEYYDDSFRIEYISESKSMISYLKSYDVDILFLDISMPEVDGFEIAEYVCENDYSTHLIFVSNFEDKVYSSFKYRPYRFIRKSLYKSEVIEALRSVVYDISLKHRCIAITHYNEVTPIRISRIIYVEKEKRSNYLNIYCAGTTYRYRGSLADFSSLVQGFDFIRPSAMINLDHVKTISGKTIFMNGDYKFEIVSPKYAAGVSKQFLEYMREK